MKYQEDLRDVFYDLIFNAAKKLSQAYKNRQNSHTGAGAVRPPVLRRCEETSYVPMRGERSESVPELYGSSVCSFI